MRMSEMSTMSRMSEVSKVSALKPCPISDRALHEIVDQGPATWDFGDIIYEGKQIFCHTCGEAMLYVESERKVRD